MALALLFGQSHTVEHTDRRGVIPASASVRLVNKDGSEITAPTVSIDSVSTTTLNTSTAEAFDLQDATGVVAGRYYAITHEGVTYRRRIGEIDSTPTVYPTAALPEAPATGSAFVGLRMSATVPDSALTEARIGDGYRLEWTYTGAAGETYQAAQEVAIVRWTWEDPVTPDEVAEYVAQAHPSQYEESRQVWAQVAEQVARRVANEVEATNRRPYLFGDSAAFREPGYHAMRLALAERGYLPPGVDASLFSRDIAREYHAEMRKVIGGLRTYDADSDGKPDQNPRGFWSSRIVL